MGSGRGKTRRASSRDESTPLGRASDETIKGLLAQEIPTGMKPDPITEAIAEEFEERGQAEDVLKAYNRISRVPTAGSDGETDALHTRIAMIKTAAVVLRSDASTEFVTADEALPTLAAAGAPLQTIAAEGDELLTILKSSRNFLADEWAPVVNELAGEGRINGEEQWVKEMVVLADRIVNDHAAPIQEDEALEAIAGIAEQATQEHSVGRFGVWVPTAELQDLFKAAELEDLSRSL